MAVSSLARPKVGLITATGGASVYDIFRPADKLVYRVHRFTASTNFVVSAGSGLVEVLLCAGGGGSGGNANQTNSYRASGAGGGGGVLHTSVSVAPGTYSISVGNGGAGGAAGQTFGGDGGNSTGFGLTAVGGGGGCSGVAHPTRGRDGGSGGSGQYGGNAVPGQGVPGHIFGAASSSGQKGNGLNYESDITGQMTTYGASVQATYNEFNVNPSGAAMLGQYGMGGVARTRYEGGTSVGQAGTAGVVVVRYPLRSL